MQSAQEQRQHMWELIGEYNWKTHWINRCAEKEGAVTRFTGGLILKITGLTGVWKKGMAQDPPAMLRSTGECVTPD